MKVSEFTHSFSPALHDLILVMRTGEPMIDLGYLTVPQCRELKKKFYQLRRAMERELKERKRARTPSTDFLEEEFQSSLAYSCICHPALPRSGDDGELHRFFFEHAVHTNLNETLSERLAQYIEPIRQKQRELEESLAQLEQAGLASSQSTEPPSPATPQNPHAYLEKLGYKEPEPPTDPDPQAQ